MTTSAKPNAQRLIVPPQLPAGVPSRIGQTSVGAVEYKNLLTPGSGFISAYDFVINPYAGCSFGCQYCYASNFNTTAKKKQDWGKWVNVKTNAVEQINNVPKGELNGKTVYMATVTDPYQPVERTAKVTQGILEAVASRQPGIKLVIQTRSTLVTRDLALLESITRQGGKVQVNMTVTTDDDTVRKLYEPGCSSIDARLRAIQAVHDAGVQSCITMTPMLPTQDPQSFAHRLLQTGIRRFICQPFHYPNQDRGSNIAQTDRKAIDCAKEHFQAPTASIAVQRYNAGYHRDFQVLQQTLLTRPDVTLGQNKAGFSPPF